MNFEMLSYAINLFNSIPHSDFRGGGWVLKAFNVLNNDQNLKKIGVRGGGRKEN